MPVGCIRASARRKARCRGDPAALAGNCRARWLDQPVLVIDRHSSLISASAAPLGDVKPGECGNFNGNTIFSLFNVDISQGCTPELYVLTRRNESQLTR